MVNPALNPSKENAPVLQVQHVSFGYNQQSGLFLYDISVQVAGGEMIALLGPNGSGKTTLLRLLSGFLQPQQGQIMLKGQDIKQWGRRAASRHIAVVPQELNMPFAFTVEQMVGLGRTPFVSSFLGTLTKQDHLIVQDAMEVTGIGALSERIFNELSGGERQRVMIAMALAQQPTILLLDEPTSHLDIKYQVETLELVHMLNQQRGVTVIAAMHDLNLAARYFPRLLLFQRGIVADAGPAEVLEPGLLGRVYGINVQVGILRGAQHLSVLPPSAASMAEQEHHFQSRVHVVAGGGSGELLMRALADAHIPFTAGPLHIGDSDYALALRLADEVIDEQPYTAISSIAIERLRACLARVSQLILCPAPVGPGNLPLLQEALHAAQNGLEVILLALPGNVVHAPTSLAEQIQATGITERDYTGGEAQQLTSMLLQSGASVVGSVGEVLDEVKSNEEN